MAIFAPPMPLDDQIEFFRVSACRALLPGVELSSWFRDPATNTREGGLPNSKHLVGLAIDIVGPLVTLRQIADRARLLGLEWELEFVGTDRQHLHLEAA